MSPISPSTLIIDLETLPGDAAVGMDLDKAPGWIPPDPVVTPRIPPSNYKDPAKIAAWLVKEIQRQSAAAFDLIDEARTKDLKQWRNGSLRPADMRIACIGWALGEDEPETIDCADDEEGGLTALLDLMADAKPARIVAHNGHGFDFPSIQLRAMRFGAYRLAGMFHQDKVWETRLYDTQILWPGEKRGKGKSLDAIAALLGIDRSGNPIGGAEVLDAYVDGRWADVTDHCLDDIRTLREVYRVLREVRND